MIGNAAKVLVAVIRSTLLSSALGSLLCTVPQMFCLASVANAEIIVSGDVSPHDPSDWTTGTDVFIGVDSDGTVMVNSGSNTQTLSVLIGWNGLSTGAATITGSGSTWTASNVFVGHGGSGTLTIADGGQVISSNGYLGYTFGSKGVARISGVGSRWTNSGLPFFVGCLGNGTLIVEAGGMVSSSQSALGVEHGSTGSARVSGNGSKWTDSVGHFVGYRGQGTLTVDDGGAVTSASGYLGFDAGSSGAVTVSGSGSSWNNSGDLYIGRSGNGTLTVENGGLVSSSNGYLGHSTGSSGAATVTGSGSTWTNTGNLYVGNSGAGTLTVDAGGTVTTGTLYASLHDLMGNGTITTKGAVLDADLVFDSTHGLQQTVAFGTGGTLNLNLDGSHILGVGYQDTGTLRIADGVAVASSAGYLGYDSGSAGTATVTGTGSKWTNGELRVGNSGSGTLFVEAGGQVSSSDGYLGYSAGSSGAVAVTGTGSSWTNTGSLYVGNSGAGTLTVDAGGAVTTGTLYASLHDLMGNGTITTKGAVLDADLVFDSTHGQTVGFGSGGTLKLGITSSPILGVGYRESGTLRVADGVAVSSSKGYLGHYASSVGVATVAGTGSKWTIGELRVGNSGSGSLSVESGGLVNSSNGYLGHGTGSSGAVTVTGTGSTWTNTGSLYVGNSGAGTLTVDAGGAVNTGTLYASLHDLMGNGTITTKGAVLDADLVFDNTHGQTVGFGSGGTLNLGLSSSQILGVGYHDTGSLRIADGVAVASSTGYLGRLAGSTGTATVTGIGSKWTNGGTLFLGYDGTGNLIVEAGGQVSSSGAAISYRSRSAGTATVRGSGSRWTNSGNLSVGGALGSGTLFIEAGGQVTNKDGRIGENDMATVTGAGSKWTNSGDLLIGIVPESGGQLTIARGGEVTAASTRINNDNLLAIYVGGGSQLRVGGGTGSITNDGVVRMIAGADLLAGAVYTPILANAWAGSGTYQAIGGRLNDASHAFTVSDAARGESGVPVTVDLMDVQRVLLSDSYTGWSVGASFVATADSKLLTLTGAVIDGTALTDLQTQSGNQLVLGGWDFNVIDYAAGSPAYLSFAVGADYSPSDLTVWRYDGIWEKYATTDLNSEGMYASFTTTDFGGYAITTVPEPSTLAMLVTGLLAAAACVWRRRQR